MLSPIPYAFLQLPLILLTSGFPGGSDGKEPAYNARDLGSIPGSGISPGEGNGNPLQYSCLKNPMDGGAWRATVHGVTKSRTRLRDFTFIFTPKISLKLLLDTLILVTFQNLPPALINKKLTHFIWESPKNTTRTQQKSSNHSF